MITLKPQMIHEDVKVLKGILIELEYYNGVENKLYDSDTVKSTMIFQIANGLSPDGVVGKKTWQVLELKDKILKFSMFQKAAKELGCEIAAILAVSNIESPRSGFLPDGRPNILFEGHVFYDRLIEYDIDPEPLQIEYSSIVYPEWDKSKYKGYGNVKTSGIDNEYERLDLARTIHEQAALESASWGKYQIMGFNYFKCGYEELSDFIYDCQISEEKHLRMFIEFIKYSDLIKPLQSGNWSHFAKIYNGKSYKKNQYDAKIEVMYMEIKQLIEY